MTEEQRLELFNQWLLKFTPGIACSLKMRNLIEEWINTKIDQLPPYQFKDEFTQIMEKNFNENQD